MHTHLKNLLLPVLAVLLIGCSSSNDQVTPLPDNNDTLEPAATTVVDVAREAGSFTTLIAALEATGLDAVLADAEGTFTVFAPTDAAFDKLPEGTVEALLADTEALTNILLYHVITTGEIDSATAIAAVGTAVPMANGDSVGISMSGAALNINLAAVTTPDVDGGNGVIHILDTVLLPPAPVGEPTSNIVETAIDDGRFGTLVTALQAAGLDGALADPDATFTVFAPTDAAFAVLGDAVNDLLMDIPALTAVLQRHVIADLAVDSVTAFTLAGNSTNTLGGEAVALSIVDGQLLINNAAVEMFDVYTTNGVIHVIDAVIMPVE